MLRINQIEFEPKKHYSYEEKLVMCSLQSIY